MVRDSLIGRRSTARLMAGAAAGALALLSGASPASAAGTVAGSLIDNEAKATYDLPDGTQSEVTSNKVSLRVDELLDVTVASADPGDVAATPGATGRVLSFTLTNSGNGSEAFTLGTRSTAGADGFDPTVTSVVLDSNGNGVYDPADDKVYTAGSNDPVLSPDASLRIFVITSVPAGVADGGRGQVDLTAAAVTGTGSAGTIFAGKGQGGGDAIVGTTGADGEDKGFLKVSSATLAFVKSATVADPFGGTSPLPGGTITYTLTATISGSGSLPNIRIADQVPTGSTYAANSLALNGNPLTDDADGDAGEFANGGVAVRLGTVAAGSAPIVTFKVRID